MKNSNTTLAFDILREQKRGIFIWRTAFIVALCSLVAVVIDRTDRTAGKGGAV